MTSKLKCYVIRRSTRHDGGLWDEWFTGRHWSDERPDAMEYGSLHDAQEACNQGVNNGRIQKGQCVIDAETTDD